MSNELNRYVETILKSAYRGNIYDNIPQNFLQYSEQGGKVILFLTPENYLAFIDKGLTAQMAENFAFIVAYKPEDRIKAESQFKDIYSLRSKLVHGESEKEIEAERDTAIAFALYALKNLLLKEEFLRLENEKEFKDLITNLKFGLR